jgi:STE24 endopeptidase
VNAYAFGLGPSRRVVLWDTLLDGRFSKGEVRAVIAHEYGHQSRDHLLKGLAWYALFALPGAYLIERLTRRKGGMRSPAAVPLSLLVLVSLQIASTPLDNLVSRHMEAEADWMSLQTTRDPASSERLFEHFTETDLAEPDPSTWSYLLLETHPTTMQRIAMVEAWKAQTRGRKP